MSARLVLVTGASGYIGGRLVPELERRGERVRCLARRPEHVRPRVSEGTEVVRGDVLDPASLRSAMAGVDAAYYLIHSMGSRGDFEGEDRRAAENLAAAARAAAAGRIVYLGGLGRGPGLSRHLRSRHEVGRILRESGVPTIELRASIVIGSGSLSFEMVRALVERLPVMITPRWVSQPTQPLAIEDLVDYLVGALDVDLDGSPVVEIGGADRVSYMDVMKEYARQRGLTRFMIRVPVLSPRLSSLWLGLVTPVYARVGRELVESTRNATVVDDDSARRLFPTLRPRGIREAIARALRNEDREFAGARLVGPALLGRHAGLGGRHLRLASGGLAFREGPEGAPRGLRARPPHRRRDRLVLRELALAAARVPRPPRGRRGGAAGPARSGEARARRCARLLAGRGLRARRAPPPCRRDEAAGPSVAPVEVEPDGHGSLDSLLYRAWLRSWVRECSQ